MKNLLIFLLVSILFTACGKVEEVKPTIPSNTNTNNNNDTIIESPKYTCNDEVVKSFFENENWPKWKTLYFTYIVYYNEIIQIKKYLIQVDDPIYIQNRRENWPKPVEVYGEYNNKWEKDNLTNMLNYNIEKINETEYKINHFNFSSGNNVNIFGKTCPIIQDTLNKYPYPLIY